MDALLCAEKPEKVVSQVKDQSGLTEALPLPGKDEAPSSPALKCPAAKPLACEVEGSGTPMKPLPGKDSPAAKPMPCEDWASKNPQGRVEAPIPGAEVKPMPVQVSNPLPEKLEAPEPNNEALQDDLFFAVPTSFTTREEQFAPQAEDDGDQECDDEGFYEDEGKKPKPKARGRP